MKKKNFVLVLLPFVFLTYSFAQTWNHIGNEVPGAIYTASLASYNGYLIAGGMFDSSDADGFAGWQNIQKWDGSVWTPFGAMNTLSPHFIWGSTVRCLTVYHNQLIAGGYFTTINGVYMNGVAEWNGNSWSPMSTGFGGNTPHLEVLYSFQDTLYAGGTFATVSGIQGSGLAKWNGDVWVPVGVILPQPEMFGAYCLTEFQGSLYFGGQYGIRIHPTYPADSACMGRLVNNQWVQVGGGIQGDSQSIVKTMVVYNGKLVVAGHFSSAGGVPVHNIAVWDGNSWSKFDTDPLDPNAFVYSMCIINDSLYIAGQMNAPSQNICKFPSNPFVNDSCNSVIAALLNYPIGSPNLIAGGWFTRIGGLSVNNLAMWGSTLVGINHDQSTATQFFLGQNYPNPFNPVTKIRFQIPKQSQVSLVVHDILGRVVTKLLNAYLNPGSYSVDWDATNFNSGVYFYTITAGDYKESKEMILLK